MKTLILTDIMKTGHHWWYAQFLKYNTIKDQQIEICDEYYNINNFNLITFDRKIAIICAMNDYLLNNKEYKLELLTRVNRLKKKGFKFILGIPWESKTTSIGNKHIELFSNISKFVWYGEDNWFWFYMYEKNYNKNFVFNHSNKKYNFLYLNKQLRPQRIKLYNHILNAGLLNNSLYTFIGLENPVRLPVEYELPWIDRKNYPWHNYDQDIYEKPYNETVCNIVPETIIENNEIFLTEKIWKAIIAEQPFVVHGCAGYLKKLQELGFKTFKNFFDESYDDQLDHDVRIKKIIETLKTIKIKDYKKLYQETTNIRQHNKKLFWNKNELSNSINKTILNFFKFIDRS
jgi:hypothetical protein